MIACKQYIGKSKFEMRLPLCWKVRVRLFDLEGYRYLKCRSNSSLFIHVYVGTQVTLMRHTPRASIRQPVCLDYVRFTSPLLAYY